MKWLGILKFRPFCLGSLFSHYRHVMFSRELFFYPSKSYLFIHGKLLKRIITLSELGQQMAQSKKVCCFQFLTHYMTLLAPAPNANKLCSSAVVTIKNTRPVNKQFSNSHVFAHLSPPSGFPLWSTWSSQRELHFCFGVQSMYETVW